MFIEFLCVFIYESALLEKSIKKQIIKHFNKYKIEAYIDIVKPRPLGDINSMGFSPTIMFLSIARTNFIVRSTIVLIWPSA